MEDISKATSLAKPDPELEKHLQAAKNRIKGKDQRVVYGVNRTAALITNLNGHDSIHIVRMEPNGQTSVEEFTDKELPQSEFPGLESSVDK